VSFHLLPSIITSYNTLKGVLIGLLLVQCTMLVVNGVSIDYELFQIILDFNQFKSVHAEVYFYFTFIIRVLISPA